MTTRVEHARETGAATSATPPARRVLLVADRAPIWDDVTRAIEARSIECAWVPASATPADVAAEAARGDTVVIVDLGPDQLRGMTVLPTCRQHARSAPVVVVVADPSLDLARRVRLSGAFYLALDPVSTDEMGSVVDNAFACLARHRPHTSVCRATRRVLLVDDDADFVTSMRSLLESQGYAVAEARSGKAALEQVRAEPPDKPLDIPKFLETVKALLGEVPQPA